MIFYRRKTILQTNEKKRKSRMKEESAGKSILKQIAEKAKVSVSTVSIILNGRGDEMRISPATQARVRECAKRADYTPNVYARKLPMWAKL